MNMYSLHYDLLHYNCYTYLTSALSSNYIYKGELTFIQATQT